MSALLLFGSAFVTVLLLVVQSANNIHGRTLLSCITSVGIGVAQLSLYKLVPGSGTLDAIAFIAGGPAGNLVALWLKRSDIAVIKRLHKKPEGRQA